MRADRRAGSATVAALVFLVVLASMAGGGVLIIRGALLREGRSVATYDQRQALEKEGERIVAALGDDPTPHSDSPHDPVWSALTSPDNPAVTVTLQDVSSALNPNWVQKNVFTRTELKSLLKDSGSADVLQQRRADTGFFTDIETAYGDLFVDGALEKYFTPYGYPNINTADEFALRKLFALRTGDEAAADVFHSHIQALLIQQRILKPDQLRTFLGLDYDRLYPVMNVEPAMNAHFVDPRILGDLLAYPELKVPHPQDAAQAILDMRASTEMTTDDLHRMIGAPDTSRIYQYLGVTTWFWKIGVTLSPASLSLIVARVPGAPDDPPRFTIVEERYSRG
jgi:hypothetical protein